jgi:hypothetical protein
MNPYFENADTDACNSKINAPKKAVCGDIFEVTAPKSEHFMLARDPKRNRWNASDAARRPLRNGASAPLKVTTRSFVALGPGSSTGGVLAF